MRSMSDKEHKVIQTLVEAVTLLVGHFDETLPPDLRAGINWHGIRTMIYDAALEADMIDMGLAVLPEKEQQ